MTNYDILLRNLLHHFAPEVPLELIETGVDNEKVLAVLNDTLKGPFGEVAIESACECKAFDGYQIAMAEVREMLNDAPLGAVTGEAEVAVRADRDMMLRNVQAMIEQNDEERNPTQPADTGLEALFDLFKALGFKMERLV